MDTILKASKQEESSIPLNNAHHQSNSDCQDLLNITSLAPAPSRDFYRLKVTKDWVSLTQWKVSHLACSSREATTETKAKLQSFSSQKNNDLKEEISKIFGNIYLDYITVLSKSKHDWILTLPDSVLANILAYIGIENLSIISSTCQRFLTISKSDQLWKIFYHQFSGKTRKMLTATRLASLFTWKTLFFFHRLQENVFPGKRLQLGPISYVKPSKPKFETKKYIEEDRIHKINKSKAKKSRRSKPRRDSGYSAVQEAIYSYIRGASNASRNFILCRSRFSNELSNEAINNVEINPNNPPSIDQFDDITFHIENPAPRLQPGNPEMKFYCSLSKSEKKNKD